MAVLAAVAKQREVCADFANSDPDCPVGFSYNATASGNQTLPNNNFTTDCCKVSIV